MGGESLRVVYVSYERRAAWHLVIYDSTTQQQLRTLVFQDEEKLYELAKRGGHAMNLEGRQAIERGISNGKGGMFLKLTAAQYAALKLR